jgi:hypothetical protein
VDEEDDEDERDEDDSLLEIILELDGRITVHDVTNKIVPTKARDRFIIKYFLSD